MERTGQTAEGKPGAQRKVAVVTGAGRGAGRAIAIALAHAGYELCLAARTREELEATRELSGLTPEQSLIVLIDLAQDDAPECLIETTCDHFGHVDVLVNNAGWAPARTPLIKLCSADQDRILATNLRAPIALSRLAAAHMAASIAALRMPPGEAIYAAAKAGLIAFTHAAFAELRGRGIKLSVIIPGLIDTPLIPQNKRLNRSLMLRPEDLAAAVMTIVNAPANVCPVEMILEPQRDPMRAAN
jgi:NAD(P)-dependent dehydrogenase (short-subunit alcohol dehydrogenase family)